MDFCMNQLKFYLIFMKVTRTNFMKISNFKFQYQLLLHLSQLLLYHLLDHTLRMDMWRLVSQPSKE